MSSNDAYRTIHCLKPGSPPSRPAISGAREAYPWDTVAYNRPWRGQIASQVRNIMPIHNHPRSLTRQNAVLATLNGPHNWVRSQLNAFPYQSPIHQQNQFVQRKNQQFTFSYMSQSDNKKKKKTMVNKFSNRDSNLFTFLNYKGRDDVWLVQIVGFTRYEEKGAFQSKK